MSILRREARELMSRGYEIGATVLNGTVERTVDGAWLVDGRSLEQVLVALEGQEVTLVAAAIREGPATRRRCCY